MLYLRRGLVPACLTLAPLLWAIPLLADTPAAPSVQASVPQIIVLQHVLPNDLVKSLHWDQSAKLPAGVTQVQPLPAQNALSVSATSAGLAEVHKVIKVLDIQPRQVQILLATAHASDADLKAAGLDLKDTVADRYAVGPAVTRFFQALTKQGAVTQTLSLTTTDNVDASMSLFYGPSVPNTFAVLPHINSDNTVTLAVHPMFSDGGAEHKITFRRTVSSGDTVVYVLPSTTPSSHLLFFATPTILPDK